MEDDPLIDKSGALAPDGGTLETLFTLGALQGPPGPMPDLSDLPIPGTIQEAAIAFVVDGWEYRFHSICHARKVRDKLMEMTLEGEL